MTRISARGLTKVYGTGGGRRVALDAVDLDVNEGELLAVTGASGSGKTTLLHCLAGLAPADSGTVTVDGIDVTHADDDTRTDLRARMMGFVFQSGNLVPALTVAENVQLPLIVTRRPAAEIRSRSAAALEQLGLGDAGPRMPAELSGGEQQRVALARVFAAEPLLVFADEPTASLDSDNAGGVVAELRRLAASGTTVVLATHDQGIARRADRRVVLVDGRLS